MYVPSQISLALLVWTKFCIHWLTQKIGIFAQLVVHFSSCSFFLIWLQEFDKTRQILIYFLMFLSTNQMIEWSSTLWKEIPCPIHRLTIFRGEWVKRWTFSVLAGRIPPVVPFVWGDSSEWNVMYLTYIPTAKLTDWK